MFSINDGASGGSNAKAVPDTVKMPRKMVELRSQLGYQNHEFQRFSTAMAETRKLMNKVSRSPDIKETFARLDEIFTGLVGDLKNVHDAFSIAVQQATYILKKARYRLINVNRKSY